VEWASALLEDCARERHGVDLFGRDNLLLGRLLTTLVPPPSRSFVSHSSDPKYAHFKSKCQSPVLHVCVHTTRQSLPLSRVPTVQPLRVVQPDAVCEVGGSTPDLSYGELGISPGEGHPEKAVH